ncbi:MAG: S-adenosyl-L-homocysteine hydrolase [Flavobacterium sp. BFFFF1]|uniref:TM2 domain-containing protein n=1 Tax=Flavobacterium sp. BFFFF1 TaxID=2015557 RepID=UPI000BCA5A9D|nr:TM2 domain-containing protein [Flavobacterium sp. BFFFF1]OYU81987.1 MAG: S-adenosyl-L-homocysteine hydrolase [Flavobacterium sp. BFFFF1]
MKIKIILTMLVLALTTSVSYASFPVERKVVTTERVTTSSSENQNVTTAKKTEAKATALTSPAAASGEKSQGIAFLFWLILGGFAAHRWYLGSPWYWNVLFIITLGGLFIWSLVDVIGILTGSYEPKDGSYKDSFF